MLHSPNSNNNVATQNANFTYQELQFCRDLHHRQNPNRTINPIRRLRTFPLCLPAKWMHQFSKSINS